MLRRNMMLARIWPRRVRSGQANGHRETSPVSRTWRYGGIDRAAF